MLSFELLTLCTSIECGPLGSGMKLFEGGDHIDLETLLHTDINSDSQTIHQPNWILNFATYMITMRVQKNSIVTFDVDPHPIFYSLLHINICKCLP